jgi:hypothetical protein
MEAGTEPPSAEWADSRDRTGATLRDLDAIRRLSEPLSRQ